MGPLAVQWLEGGGGEDVKEIAGGDAEYGCWCCWEVAKVEDEDVYCEL